MTKNTQEIDIGGRGGGVVSKVQSLGPLHYSRLYSPQLLRNVDHNGVGVYLSPCLSLPLQNKSPLNIATHSVDQG